MKDFYAVLEVEKTADTDTIRRSFEIQTERIESSPNKQRWVKAKKRILETALKTLTNRKKRQEYDRGIVDPIEEVLRQDKSPVGRSRLILHYLLNGEGESAIREMEMAKAIDLTFGVWKYLVPHDSLDCEFLLAEAYECQGKWTKALPLYEKVYDQEKNNPTRYFLEEVKDRIRAIYCRKIAKRVPPVEAIQVYKRVMDMGCDKKTRAFLYKKLAEACLKAGLREQSEKHFEMAMEIEPNLKGTDIIKKRLATSVG